MRNQIPAPVTPTPCRPVGTQDPGRGSGRGGAHRPEPAARRGIRARWPLGTGGGGRRVREAGMATAEYAVATLAAVGFAGLLLALLRSGEVRSLLSSIIRRALSVG